MAGSLILRNAKKLQQTISNEINYTDLDFDLNGKRGVTVYYGDALIVSYILWLRSMPGDYIREPDVGGFFRNQLNRYKFDSSSESQIVEDLKTESKSEFPDINVKCVFSERKWQVKVSVLDNNTGIIGSTVSSIAATN